MQGCVDDSGWISREIERRLVSKGRRCRASRDLSAEEDVGVKNRSDALDQLNARIGYLARFDGRDMCGRYVHHPRKLTLREVLLQTEVPELSLIHI